jgi:hypothetical protein
MVAVTASTLVVEKLRVKEEVNVKREKGCREGLMIFLPFKVK